MPEFEQIEAAGAKPETAEVKPVTFDVGLANAIIENSLKLTAEKNFDDDKLHVMRNGSQINIEVKLPDGAVSVFSADDSEKRLADSVYSFRPGEWVKYLIQKAQEQAKAAEEQPQEEPVSFKPIDDTDLFKKPE